MIPLEHVRRGVGEHELAYPVAADLEFSAVTHDSRLVGPGSLFVALRGEQDGHEFVLDAYRRGAQGVLAERLVGTLWLPEESRARFAYLIVPDTLRALHQLASYWREHCRVKVIAVTGSVGKTTTKEMIATVLSRRFPLLRNAANMNTEIGLPLSLLQLEPTHQRAVLEMGMYALGEITTLCRISQPSIGVVTNVGPTHLERLGGLDQIAQAKGELPACLPAEGWAVLNGDDQRVRAMPTQAQRLLFGLEPGCQVRAERLESWGLEGIKFVLRLDGRRFPVANPLLGKQNVYACLAAAAVGVVEGLSDEEIEAGLATVPETLRVRVVPGPNGARLIDDTYNASPVSTMAALDFLAELPGRHLAVLGDMLELGSYAEDGHRLVGRRAAEVLDHLVVVGRQARWIGEEARASGFSKVEFAVNNDEVKLDLQPGDWVLVKGSRGMRMETLVARLAQEAR